MTAIPTLPSLNNRQLAALVGCDPKTITNLRRKGMPDPKAEPALAIKWYCVHIDTGRVADPKSRARIESARADLLEMQAMEQRGRVAPIEFLEEQLMEHAGMAVNELDGTEARLQRLASGSPQLAKEIKTEFLTMRENWARSVARHIEKMEALAAKEREREARRNGNGHA